MADDGTVRTRVPSKRSTDPGNPNRFTSSRRITCCRILKAPFCPRWLDWAQGGVSNGRGSPGWASRSTLWSPAAQKELLTHCEPDDIRNACTRGVARPRRRNDRFNGSPRWPFLPGEARIVLGSTLDELKSINDSVMLQTYTDDNQYRSELTHF